MTDQDKKVLVQLQEQIKIDLPKIKTSNILLKESTVIGTAFKDAESTEEIAIQLINFGLA